MCFVLRSYLAHIGLRERSSARLESWWPHTHTSLGPSPHCSQFVMLLQEKTRQREMLSVEDVTTAVCLLLHPVFILRCLSVALFLFLLYSDLEVSCSKLLQHPLKSALLLFL